jgi:hypothetical protein
MGGEYRGRNPSDETVLLELHFLNLTTGPCNSWKLRNRRTNVTLVQLHSFVCDSYHSLAN